MITDYETPRIAELRIRSTFFFVFELQIGCGVSAAVNPLKSGTEGSSQAISYKDRELSPESFLHTFNSLLSESKIDQTTSIFSSS